MMDAHEGGYVATVDLLGAFLHTDKNPADNTTPLVLRDKLAELMEQVDSKLYRRYINTNKSGKKMMYVWLEKRSAGLSRWRSCSVRSC